MPLQNVSPELLRRCQKGEPEAFEELFSLTSRDLYRLIYSFLRDPDDTDEVVQECYIRIYRHLPSLREVEKFYGWVMRVIVNQCNTYRAQKGRRQVYNLDEQIEVKNEDIAFRSRPPDSPRQNLLRNELGGEILAAVDRLPNRQRAAIILYELEGNSIKEIAGALNCSEGAVKFNLHQARKRLQQELLPYLRHGTGSPPADKAKDSERK